MWPVLTGAELVHDLFCFPALVRSAADGVLTRDEQERLHRAARRPTCATCRGPKPTSRSIDEADALLGLARVGPAAPARPARRGGDDAASRVVAELGVGGFLTAPRSRAVRRSTGAGGRRRRRAAHVRARARRRGPGSLADAVADARPPLPVGLDDAGRRLRPGEPGRIARRAGTRCSRSCPRTRPPATSTLTVNYRTPAEIMEVARRVLAAAAPGIEPPRAVRTTGVEPEFVARRRRRPGRAGRGARAREAVVRPGTVAIIAPPDLHARARRRARRRRRGRRLAEALDAPIAVLGPVEAKGLEFDHVVVGGAGRARAARSRRAAAALRHAHPRDAAARWSCTRSRCPKRSRRRPRDAVRPHAHDPMNDVMAP